jgi:hypothetical protein
VVAAGSQPVDSVDAALDFDPAYLQAQGVTPGSSLPTVLANSFDNSNGTITFSAGKQLGGQDVTGTFTLATISLQALAATPSGGTPLTFVFQPPTRNTDAFCCGGTSVFCCATDGTVTVAAPTAVALVSFTAHAADSAVHLAWQMAGEANTLGFNVWRQRVDSGSAAWAKLNETLIAAEAIGELSASRYRYLDRAVQPGQAYAYKVEIIGVEGSVQWTGPLTVTLARPAGRAPRQ